MTTLDPPAAPAPSLSRAPATYEVTNQVPPLIGHDVGRRPGAAGRSRARGRRLVRLRAAPPGSPGRQAQRWADQANRFAPELRTVDRYGHRLDEVEFHPAWHSLLDVAVAVGAGLAGAPWADDRPGAHVARAAGF